MVEKDQMSGLFSTEIEPALPHCVHDVAVADVAAQQLTAIRFDRALEAEVAHDRSDEGASPKALGAKHARRAQCHDHVAVDLIAFLVDHDDAVGVAVEGDAEVGAALSDLFGAGLRVQRADLVVDVFAVGPHPNGMGRRTEL